MMYGLPSPQQTFESLQENANDPVMMASILEQLCTVLVMGIQEYLVTFNASVGLNTLLVLAGKVPTTPPSVAKMRETVANSKGTKKNSGGLSVLLTDHDCTLYALRCIGNIAEHVPSSAAAIKSQLAPLLNFLTIALLRRAPVAQAQQRYLGDPTATYEMDFLVEELVKVVQLVALEDAENLTMHSGILSLLALEYLPSPTLDLRSKQVIIEAFQNVSQRLLPRGSLVGQQQAAAAASSTQHSGGGVDIVIDALHAVIVEAERRRKVLGAKEWRTVAAACECLDTVIMRSHATGDAATILRAAGGDPKSSSATATTYTLSTIMCALFELAHAPENPHQLLTLALLTTIGRGAPSLMRRALCAMPPHQASTTNPAFTPSAQPPAYSLLESLLKVSEHSEIDVFLEDPFSKDRAAMIQAYSKKMVGGNSSAAQTGSGAANNSTKGKKDPLLIAAALQLLSICTPPVISPYKADSMLLLLRSWSWEDDMHSYTHYSPDDAKTLEKVLILGVEHVFTISSGGRQYTVDTSSMKQIRGSVKNKGGTRDEYGSEQNAQRSRELASQFATGEGSRNVKRVVTPVGYTLLSERRTHLARDYHSANCVEESAQLLMKYGALVSRFAISSSDATFKFVAVQFIAQCYQFMRKAQRQQGPTQTTTHIAHVWLKTEAPAVWDLILDALQTASVKSSETVHQFASHKIREGNNPSNGGANARPGCDSDWMSEMADNLGIYIGSDDDTEDQANSKRNAAKKSKRKHPFRKPTSLQTSALVIAEELISHPDEDIAIAGIQAGLRRGADDIIGNICPELEQGDRVLGVLRAARSGEGLGGFGGVGDNEIVATLTSSLQSFARGSPSYQNAYLAELITLLGTPQIQLMTPYEFAQLGIARVLIGFLTTDDDIEYKRRAELFAACLMRSPVGCQNLVRKLVDALPYLGEFQLVQCPVSDKPARCRTVLEALEILSAVSPQVEMCRAAATAQKADTERLPAVCCPEGHALEQCGPESDWECHICECPRSEYVLRRCHKCHFDVCLVCYKAEEDRNLKDCSGNQEVAATTTATTAATTADDNDVPQQQQQPPDQEDEDNCDGFDFDLFGPSSGAPVIQEETTPSSAQKRRFLTFRIPLEDPAPIPKKDGDESPLRVAAHLMATVGDVESYFRGSKSPLAVRLQAHLDEFQEMYNHLVERFASDEAFDVELDDPSLTPEQRNHRLGRALQRQVTLTKANQILASRKESVKKALADLPPNDDSGDNNGRTYKGRLELFNKGLGRCSYQETLYSLIYKKVKLLGNSNEAFYKALLLELEKALMTDDLGGGMAMRPPPPPPEPWRPGAKKKGAQKGQAPTNCLGLGVGALIPDFPANRYLQPVPPVARGAYMTLGQIEQTSLIATRNVMFHFFRHEDDEDELLETNRAASEDSDHPLVVESSDGFLSTLEDEEDTNSAISTVSQQHVDPTISPLKKQAVGSKKNKRTMCVCGCHSRDELAVNDLVIYDNILHEEGEEAALGDEDEGGGNPSHIPEAILLTLIYDLYRHAVGGNTPSELADVVPPSGTRPPSMGSPFDSSTLLGSDASRCASLADILSPESFVSGPLSKRVVHSLSACALRVALLDPQYAIPTWAHGLLVELPFLLTPITRQRSAAFLAFQARRALWELLREADARAPADISIYPSEWIPVAPNSNSRRVHVVDGANLVSSTRKLLQETAELRFPLAIQINGDVGTGLGPTLQFFTNVSKELCRRRVGGRDGAQQFWRTPSAEPSEADAEAEFVPVGKEGLYPSILDPRSRSTVQAAEEAFYVLGGLLARGYMDGRLVPIPLSPMLVHFLRVGKPYIVHKATAGTNKWMSLRYERVSETSDGDLLLPSSALSRQLVDGNMDGATSLVFSPNYRTSLSSRNIAFVDQSLHSTLKSLRQYAKRTKDTSASHSERQAAAMALEMMDLPFLLPGSPDPDPSNPGGCLLMHPDGHNLILSGDNASHYLVSVVEGVLFWGVSRQIDAFINGFRDVLPVGALQVLSTAELTRVLCGVEGSEEGGSMWSLDDISSILIADHGYAKDSPQVLWLKELLVETLSRKQQKMFLEFLTGCPRLPVGGLKSLGNITIVKKSVVGTTSAAEPAPSSSSPSAGRTQVVDDNVLISVNTCFHYLKVPPYTSKTILHQRLLQSMEGSAGFDLS